MDLRTVTFDVPPQEILSRDSVTVTVDAVIYYRVSNPTMVSIFIWHAETYISSVYDDGFGFSLKQTNQNPSRFSVDTRYLRYSKCGQAVTFSDVTFVD